MGWGYAEPGYNVILAKPSDWHARVPIGVLLHMGKHAFLLLMDESGSLPKATRDYLAVLRPTRTHPSEQVHNFGRIMDPDMPGATFRGVPALLSVADGSR